MKTILIAVDFSAATAAVVETAAELASNGKARLVFYHAEPIPAVVLACPVAGAELVEFIADTEQAALDRLRRLAAPFAGASSFVEPAHWPIAQQILHAAQDNQANLIVLGSHGHGAVHELLLGGTAHGVLKHAKCPVLIVPAAAGVAALGGR